MSELITSFTPHVPEQDLEDLKRRLSQTRWPETLNNDPWNYGIDLGYLTDLCHYWQQDFDWREQEAKINRFAHFKISIDGLELHFIHQRSPYKNARPLIITHGWPGSFVEFLDIIAPLTDPVAHGGREQDAFHVICPSIPGYGYSEAGTEAGINVESVTRRFMTLMARLGYSRYFAQGGDWGAIISSHLGRIDAEHCAGVHLNMVFPHPPGDDRSNTKGLSEANVNQLKQTRHLGRSEMAYSQLQGTKPQTLSPGLADSPAAQAAWIAEKFHAWTDNQGNIEDAISRDALLTNISLYWFTNTGGSSARLYLEERRQPTSHSYVSVPTGVAIFPREPVQCPRSWAEARYNITRWTTMSRGGHFPAMEQAATLVTDIREFVNQLEISPSH